MLKTMAPQRLQKEGPKSHIPGLFEFTKHRKRNTTLENQGDDRKTQTELESRMSTPILKTMAPQRFQKEGQKSHILGLFEVSKHRKRNTSLENQGDGRKSQTALGSGISGANFEDNGSPKASKGGPEIAYTRVV